MLDVRNLDVHYGAIRAVRDVSLYIEKGEVVSLLGANGAGKTSLVSACVGIIPKSGGQVTFDGMDVSRQAAEGIVRSGMTLSPEGRRVFADLSVRENMLLGAATRRDRAEVARDIETYFKMFPILGERSDQAAKTLSGGEQQMLAIARALMSRPRLLMLDEPSLGLAPRIVEGIFELVGRLRAEGLTILLLEQNATEALRISDRAYVMASGRLVYDGRAADLANSDELMGAYLGTGME